MRHGPFPHRFNERPVVTLTGTVPSWRGNVRLVRRILGWARSRKPVLTVAIVSQVVIIAGLVLWGTELGAAATGSLPAVSPGTLTAARITAWVSDPAWHVAPTLTVGQQTWTVGLSPSQEPTDPDAKAVVVLWGAAQHGISSSSGAGRCGPGTDCAAIRRIR